MNRCPRIIVSLVKINFTVDEALNLIDIPTVTHSNFKFKPWREQNLKNHSTISPACSIAKLARSIFLVELCLPLH